MAPRRTQDRTPEPGRPSHSLKSRTSKYFDTSPMYSQHSSATGSLRQDSAQRRHRLRTRLSDYKDESPTPIPLHTPTLRNGRSNKKITVEDSVDSPPVDRAEDDLLPVLVLQNEPRRPRKRPNRGYAPPEVYDLLHMLPDYLEPDLDGKNDAPPYVYKP